MRRGGPLSARTLLGAQAPSAGRVNVTPMIDVVMVLIVFYLIVGHLALQKRGAVLLPAAAEGEVERPTDRPLIVLVNAEGGLMLEGEPVPPGGFSAALRAAAGAEPDRPVQLRGDRSLAYREIAPVLEACREAGVRSVQLATRQDGRAERTP